MDMTFSQYIANPMGKNNAVMNSVAREAIRADYLKRFDALLVREHGSIVYNIYKDEKKNRYYFHIKVPSETVEKFYYDVVLEFYTDNNIKGAGQDLMKWYVNFFSNDPAFVYIYAYVFRVNNLFVKCMKPRMSNMALEQKAKEKNPKNQIGYVKSIYFAYLTILNKGLTNINHVDAESQPFKEDYLVSQVEYADIKISQRESEEKKLKKKKDAVTRRPKSNSDNVKYTNSSATAIKTTKRISAVNRTVPTVAKTTSRVKTTKRK